MTDGLSSTQLYILIVLVTVLISSLLLRNAPEFCTDDVDGIHKELAAAAAAQRASDLTSNKQKKWKRQQGASKRWSVSDNGEPEPRWYIFRMFNYGMMVAFVASVVAFFIEFTAISNNTGTSISMLRYLLGWSVFLIYFFGFFGVSIVNDVEQSDDSGDEAHHAAAVSASSSAEETSVSAMTDPSVVQKTIDAACGLGCSVPTNDDTNPSW